MSDIPATPPLRADARRNRDAILVAARTVFAEQGLDAPLDAIAKRAGVGRATLYRRFPNRDALISAIFDDNFDLLEKIAATAGDSDRLYFTLLEATFELQSETSGFIDLFSRRPLAPELLAKISLRFHAVIDGPLAAAQAAGQVRADLRPDDTGTLVMMVGAVTANLRDVPNGAEHRRRAINLVFDALDPARAPRDLDT